MPRRSPSAYTTKASPWRVSCLPVRCSTTAPRRGPTSDARSIWVGRMVPTTSGGPATWAPNPEATPPPECAVPARRSDLAGLPPTWIGVGDLDVFWDEDIEYARRLEEAGVSVTLETAKGGPHGYQAIAPKAAISKRFNASAAAFAKEMLNG